MQQAHATDARLGDYIARNLDRYVEELSAFARIPSVAAHRTGIGDAVAFVRAAFERRGFATRAVATRGNPVVVAEAGAGARSVLLYNHYDVQPAEPLAQWSTPPFEPALRGGALYARGAIDDKGELIARLAALDALLAVHGALPLRVVAAVEGEEEIGSPNLEAFVAENAEALRADACIWEAGTVDDDGRPHLWLGVRGIAYVELVARTLSHDAHSGWAHVLPNAAWRLVHALSTLKDERDEITIAGIGDGVLPPTAAQERLLAAMPNEDADYAREYGLRGLAGGRTGLAARRMLFRPTCNISGIWSGYQGDGTKTVIPGEARAKLDFRLVPDQDPDAVVRALRAHLDAHGFGDVEVVHAEGQRAAVADPDHPFIALATRVARAVYGAEPVVAPIVGGTGPARFFLEHLGTPFVSIGCSYPGGRKHAPDENVRLADFVRGATCIAQVLAAFAEQSAA